MENSLEKIVSLCKRRGFVYPNSEIYGGIQGFYDYGPLGVEMKNNIKNLWWTFMTRQHENVVGIDGAIITHPKVWEASGHIQNFKEPLVECKKCHKRFSQDKLEVNNCPECGGELTAPKKFNTLVEASIGIVEGDKKTIYLRGEACQNIYLNYENVLNSSRLKIPFGIVQIGKAFRNEITTKQFLFRLREFEQWDLQWFTDSKQMNKWFLFWKEARMNWYRQLVNNKDNVRFYEHPKDKLAHYAKKAFDIEYCAPWGWAEWEGIHWRGDWDLSRHGQYSKKDFTYTDPDTGEKFIPSIVETSGGVDRTFLFLLIDAYREEKERVVLKLHPKIAPYKVAIFPLLKNKADLVAKAKNIYNDLKQIYSVVFDDRGNIGKRYYAQDEIGTPWCITVDFETLTDNSVTIRDRDTTKQERIPVDQLTTYLNDQLAK